MLNNKMKNDWLNANMSTGACDFYCDDPDEQAINFFRLWRIIQWKEWFAPLIKDLETHVPLTDFINCARLADEIGEFHGWREI